MLLQALYETVTGDTLSIAGGVLQSEPQVHFDDKKQKNTR